MLEIENTRGKRGLSESKIIKDKLAANHESYRASVYFTGFYKEFMHMDKQTILNHLNHDLANELGAIIQYITYAAKATGPYRPQLAAFFLAEVADEQEHALYLANKIVALHGEPTTIAAAVPVVTTNREMLEAVLAAEKQAAIDYEIRANEAEAFGDKGLVIQLEDMLRDESGHAEETERMLRDWPF